MKIYFPQYYLWFWNLLVLITELIIYEPKALIPFVTFLPGADHFSGPLHHRSTILSALGPTTPSRFCFWELTSNFPVGHPSWECSDLLLA
ncbi:hypothetical protein EV1_006121 [Malus domestica]